MEQEIQEIVKYFKVNLEGKTGHYASEVQRLEKQWNEKGKEPCYLMEIAYSITKRKSREILYEAVFEIAYNGTITYISLQGNELLNPDSHRITRVARVYPKQVVREIYIEKDK